MEVNPYNLHGLGDLRLCAGRGTGGCLGQFILSWGNPQPKLTNGQGAQIVSSQIGCEVNCHARTINLVRSQGGVVPVYLK